MSKVTSSYIFVSPIACYVKVSCCCDTRKYAYRQAEVESFINNAVSEALQDSASQADHGALVDILVQSLERDAAWVDLYGITGELVVPPVTSPHDHLNEALECAKAVSFPLPRCRYSLTSCFIDS